MRALRQNSLNGPQDLQLITDGPVPSAGPAEVLIRVTAAGVNYVDISQARGTFAGGPQPPYLAGIEGAGEIIAVGEAVTDLEPGNHIIGAGIGGGAFAEYMTLPAAAAIPVPAGWSDGQALGMVVSWPTALAALKPLGGITAGQTVLIHAAAGGTGQVAVKLAKHYGATVIGTASAAKHEVVRAQGADHVIGLNIGVLIQAAPQVFGEVMNELFELIAAGVLGPGQPTAYPLDEGAQTLAALEARTTVGRLALIP
ncbi:MAG: alcohol dehydrogenase catalytic domain-containing protein [Nakamurella sp.]